MHSYLQTKAVSLAMEAKYIRKQEKRFAKKARQSLENGKDRNAAWQEKNREGQYVHRVTVVREEARITNIARGFLRGKEYAEIENKAYTDPNWIRIWNLIDTYGERNNPRWNQSFEDRWAEWLNNAIKHLADQEDQRELEAMIDAGEGDD
jgi:hypothetical protein